MQRNHIEPRKRVAGRDEGGGGTCGAAPRVSKSLLGIEGSAARVYFEEFAGMIKTGR